MQLGIVFLGTSAAIPTKERWLPCIAVLHRGSIILLDVGEGCQYRLLEEGLSPLRVEAILVTHLHGDHFYGLPGLLQSMSMMGREKDLLLIGPRGLAEYIETVLNTTRHDPAYRLLLLEAREGPLAEIGGLRIEAFRVDHGGIEAYGYRLSGKERKKLRIDILETHYGLKPGPYVKKLLRGEEVEVGGRKLDPETLVYTVKPPVIVYTGDTRPCKCVEKAARNATILIHEATFTLDRRREALEEGHSTAWDAAVTAKRAGVRLLVLTHISARYRDPEPLAEEARRVFPQSIVAEDHMRILLY